MAAEVRVVVGLAELSWFGDELAVRQVSEAHVTEILRRTGEWLQLALPDQER